MLRKSNVYFYLLTRNMKSTIYARISVGEEKVARSTSQKVKKEDWNQDTENELVILNGYLENLEKVRLW